MTRRTAPVVRQAPFSARLAPEDVAQLRALAKADSRTIAGEIRWLVARRAEELTLLIRRARKRSARR